MTFEQWMQRCDALMAMATEGRTTSDAGEYDWFGAYTWGVTPPDAAREASRLSG